MTASTAIGQVQVWTGEVSTSFTLHVCDDPKYGLVLRDASGTAVTPKSPRLGYYGRNAGATCHQINLDNLPDEFVERLTQAGYRNVTAHG